MILDTGICTVFRKTDVSEPGGMPQIGYQKIACGMFGEVSFTSQPSWQTDGRKSLNIVNKIRILQNRNIRENDVVILEELQNWNSRSSGAEVYNIVRTWHGQDDNGPAPVTDLTLEVTEP